MMKPRAGARGESPPLVFVRREDTVFTSVEEILPSVCPYRNISPYQWQRCREEVSVGGKLIIVYLDYNPDVGQLQYLVAYQGGQVKFESIVSGAKGDIDRPNDDHPNSPHNHLGLFRITSKQSYHWSKRTNVICILACFISTDMSSTLRHMSKNSARPPQTVVSEITPNFNLGFIIGLILILGS